MAAHGGFFTAANAALQQLQQAKDDLEQISNQLSTPMPELVAQLPQIFTRLIHRATQLSNLLPPQAQQLPQALQALEELSGPLIAQYPLADHENKAQQLNLLKSELQSATQVLRNLTAHHIAALQHQLDVQSSIYDPRAGGG